MEDQALICKIVVLGDSGVGKTSLLRRQVEQSFNLQHMMFLEVDFMMKKYIAGDITVKAQLWDTAGQERFNAIHKAYYRNAKAVLLCFDLSNPTTLDRLNYWFEEANKANAESNLYLIGCKSDLQINVSSDEILKFSATNKVAYMQTSAKSGVGVQECFQKVIKDLVIANMASKTLLNQINQNFKVKSVPINRSCEC